ncbi:MAG: sulfite exporter TauE/SafE family protein [Phycisphaeraceae bacterium]|nr:sulfite exporter TauE/SafE family protein [Phycisphaeraceae bacterium]
MDTTQLILAVLAILIAAVVQASIGFGAGMIILPMLLWAGMEMGPILALMSGAVIAQLTVKLWHYRKEIPWRLVLWPVGIARLIGYVPGFALLWVLANSSTDIVKQAVGAMILVALGLQLGLRIKPREQLAQGWGWLAGFTGGVTAGAVGMGGPPLVLWVVAHDWPAKQARLFLWASFWFVMPIQIVVLVMMFEPATQLKMAGIGALTLPIAMLGTAAGLWLGHRIPKRQLRWAMIALLLVLGVTSLVEPML